MCIFYLWTNLYAGITSEASVINGCGERHLRFSKQKEVFPLLRKMQRDKGQRFKVSITYYKKETKSPHLDRYPSWASSGKDKRKTQGSVKKGQQSLSNWLICFFMCVISILIVFLFIFFSSLPTFLTPISVVVAYILLQVLRLVIIVQWNHF